MEHTFLLLEALWRTEGEFFDGTGNRAQVEGQASIRHYPEKWIYEGSLRAVGARPVEHRTIYEIQPLAPGNLATGWTSSSASLGSLLAFTTAANRASRSAPDSTTARPPRSRRQARSSPREFFAPR